MTTDHLVPRTQAACVLRAGPHFLLCMGLFSRFCIWALRRAAEAYLLCVRDTNSPVPCTGGGDAVRSYRIKAASLIFRPSRPPSNARRP